MNSKIAETKSSNILIFSIFFTIFILKQIEMIKNLGFETKAKNVSGSQLSFCRIFLSAAFLFNFSFDQVR